MAHTRSSPPSAQAGKVVLLLAVIAFHTAMSPHSVQAKTQHKYLAVMSYGSGAAQGFGIQADLDKYAADGWELAAPIS